MYRRIEDLSKKNRGDNYLILTPNSHIRIAN